MFKRALLILILFLSTRICFAQNISGVINSYVAVTNISGTSLVVATSTAFAGGDRLLLIQMKGASIATVNTSSFGDISSIGGAGTYEFFDVSFATGTVIVVSTSPTHTYNFATGNVQAVRVPKYCTPTVNTTLTCAAWNGTTGTGGILAFEAGTLTLNSDINVSALGFRGGNYATSSFCCSNGNYSGAAGGSGGEKGESISAYLTNLNGLRGKQANGGGASNCDNAGAGGGGNAGPGGIGGNQYSGCGTFDDRGVGGSSLVASFSTMFMGGGGGGGFRDNGQVATPGGNGGGIVYIRANVIICNSRTITASGGSVTVIANDEGAGGGGAGGTIFLECTNFTGNLTVRMDGGNGGSNNNSFFPTNCHGPGGGGGGGTFAYSPFALPSGITITAIGGAAGTVNNTSSTCFGTNFGAGYGFGGTSLAGLPAVAQAFNIPTLSIVQSNSICAGQTASLTANGASSYSWSSGPTTSVIAISPPTTTQYTLVGQNGTCSTSIVHTVVVTPGPTINIVATPSICSSQTANISASGATTYTWNTGATSSSITVSPLITTVYTVTGSDSGCSNTVTDTIFVTTTPTVSISGTISICSGQTTTLVAASASSYSWNTGATTAALVVSPTVGTNYQVVGANGTCSMSAMHFVNVIANPILNIVGTNSLCAGSSINISASGATTYSWNTSANSALISVAPTLPGTAVYQVTATTNGCSSNLTHTLLVIPMPTVSIVGISHICSGQSLTLSASYAYTVTWNTGSTASLISVSPSVSTTYSVLGANGECTVSANKSISVTPSPTLIVSALSPSICSGNTTQINGSGANAYQWNTGATNPLITVAPLSTTVYTLSGHSNNCTSVKEITITVVPTPTLSVGNYSICIGVTQATMVASGALNYSWSPFTYLSSTSGSVVIANPPTSSTYTLQGFNSTCSSSVLVDIQTFTVPTVVISATKDFLCKGEPTTLTASGASSYDWEPASEIINSTSQSIFVVPLSTTVFTLTGYGGNMCSGAATKTITVLSPPEIKIGSEYYVTCADVPVQISASGASSYSWTPTIGLNANTQSVVMASPPATQNYTVTGYIGTPPFACGTSSNILVVIQPISILSIKAPDSICDNQKIQLLASGAKDFTWTPATFLNNAFVANPYISPKSAIIYTINGTGTGSCVGTTTLNIEVKPSPFAYAGRDTTLNFDESAFLNGQGDGWLYTWIGDDMSGLSCINCPQAYIHPQYSACYILEVENSHGCTARDEVCIKVTNDHAVYIPNSFTPNGDGLNDLFTPVGFGVIEFNLDIYDRWGEKLFSGGGSFTEGPLVSWDGNYKGQRCKSDNYVYKFVYRLRGSKQLVKEGEIILLNPKD